MPKGPRGITRALPIALLLLGASCFEPPITESVEIRFLAPEGIAVTVSVALSAAGGGDNRALDERLEQTARDLMEGRDDWSRRLARLEPAIERGSWEKQEGRLSRWVRSAAFEDPRALASFFSDTPIHPLVSGGEQWQELSLTPGRATRATRDQARKVDEALDRWSEVLAAYFAAGEQLQRHVKGSPERARACYGSIFSSYLSEEARMALPEPDDDDRAVLQPVEDSMKEALDVLEVAAGDAYSIDELSRVVFDPFPATLIVRVPGPVMEVEGFATSPDGRLVAPPTSLWSALRSLEGRFLTPDPMIAIVAYSRSESKEGFDLDAFLARPRRAVSAPTAIDVGDAIRNAMAPASDYRVRWSTAGLENKDEAADWVTGVRPLEH